MTDSLIIKIITVKSLIIQAQADLVILPGSEGELGILPKHISLIAKLKAGIVKIILSGQESRYFIYDAIAEITGEYVNILTDFSIDLATISKKQILEQINLLEARLIKELAEHDIITIRANLEQQQALLKTLI